MSLPYKPKHVRLMAKFEAYDDAPYQEWGQVRPVVAEFALQMEQKLAKNDHKTDWQTLPIEAHRRKLELEVEEYKIALQFEGPSAAKLELVDIANFCLILWDRIRAEEQNAHKPEPDLSA